MHKFSIASFGREPTGLSLARSLKADFHVLEDEERDEYSEASLAKLATIFPTMELNILRKTVKIRKRYVPMFSEADKSLKRISTNNDECLVLNHGYSLNTDLFVDFNRDKTLRLLEFSQEFKNYAQDLLDEMKSKLGPAALCIHLGSGALTRAKNRTELEIEISKAAAVLTMEKNFFDLYIFSDQNFPPKLITSLRSRFGWHMNVHVADFSQMLDLYVASRVCGAALLTDTLSMHGWFLGYLTQIQENVYYVAKEDEAVLGQIML
ncbi:unnamed protein product [Cylicocyclus nassatus]|uniref:Uncharacterized protein n=1 Tax=Cylicocyclus nassatus TaxID=53992 RepID=A0AA36DV28_CYLNA|nr:unnamed protein product [Cylicocyclus nassatus]